MTMARTLSNRIEAIEYIHAGDQRPYRHDFTRADSRISLRKDGSVLIRNAKGNKLWADFTVDSGTTRPFLINPQGVQTSTNRAMAKARRGKGGKFVKSTRVSVRKANPPKKKRRRPPGTALSAAPSKRRRRRNPPMFSMQGVVRSATNAFLDGALVTGGKLGTRFVSSKTSYANGSMMQSIVEAGTTLVICAFGPRVLGADKARMVAAGAASSIVERLAKQIGIPQVTSLLSGVPIGVNTREVYPAADGSRVEGYSGPVRDLPASRMDGYSRVEGYGGPATRERARRAALATG